MVKEERSKSLFGTTTLACPSLPSGCCLALGGPAVHQASRLKRRGLIAPGTTA